MSPSSTDLFEVSANFVSHFETFNDESFDKHHFSLHYETTTR